jgi:hypothetical protein
LLASLVRQEQQQDEESAEIFLARQTIEHWCRRTVISVSVRTNRGLLKMAVAQERGTEVQKMWLVFFNEEVARVFGLAH